MRPSENSLVVLRSGGPVMTCEAVRRGKVVCFWTDEKGGIRRGSFDPATLYMIIDDDMAAQIKESLDDTDQLYKAAEAFVVNRGGKIVVIGGVEIQKWPQDLEFVFRVAVKCTGKQPEMPEGGTDAQ